MPGALNSDQLDLMKSFLRSRAEELRTSGDRLLEIQTRIHTIKVHIDELEEKARINREFLSALTKLGKFTSHFRDQDATSPARELERAERDIHAALVVLVANNRHSAGTQLKERLYIEGADLMQELNELRKKHDENQQKHDEMAEYIEAYYRDKI